MINAGPIYNKIRSSLVEKYALLDTLLPAPVGDVYMTLEAYKQFSTPELQQAAAAVKNKIEKGE